MFIMIELNRLYDDIKFHLKFPKMKKFKYIFLTIRKMEKNKNIFEKIFKTSTRIYNVLKRPYY